MSNSLHDFFHLNKEEKINVDNWLEIAKEKKFECIITCPIAIQFFSQFLAQEFTVENLNAFHDIRSFMDYSMNTSVNEEELKEKLLKIEQYYIAQEAPFESKI